MNEWQPALGPGRYVAGKEYPAHHFENSDGRTTDAISVNGIEFRADDFLLRVVAPDGFAGVIEILPRISQAGL